MRGFRYSLRLLILVTACATSNFAVAQDFSLVPGTVISHSPRTSGKYIGSPSIAILPNGDYVASHDFFGPSAGHTVLATSQVFRSTDQGQTWNLQATLSGQFWSNLFYHNDALYLMGTDKEYGRIVIRRSEDGGATWTTPTSATTGRLTSVSAYHTAPMPMIIHEGRIWRAFEDTLAGGGWGASFRSLVMSAPIDANLLDASSWTLSNALPRNTQWLGGVFNAWLEGNVVLTPEGEMVNMLRVDNRPVAATVQVNTTDHTVSFDPNTGFSELPGGAKKFAIRYDDVSGKYWALSSPALPQHQGLSDASTRNALAMISSTDLKAWEVEAVLVHHPDTSKHGFQYPDFQFDGDDLIAAVRTAYDDGLGGANNHHDANFLTFHRVEDFRTFNPKHVLVADMNNDRILRYQTLPGEKWVPLGTFASGNVGGAALDNPFGMVQDAKENVYVGEQKDGGRILRFDAGGNFLNVVAQEGIHFNGRPEALTLSPDGDLLMSVAFGTNSDRIYKIDLADDSTALFVDTTFAGGTLENPRAISFGGGNLYVADRQSGQIRGFDGNSGEFLGNLWSQSTPQGLAWNSVEQAFVVSALSTNQLFSVDLNGNASSLYSLAGNGPALGIVEIDGKIFWSDFQNGRIFELTGTDQRLEVASGLSGPSHLVAVDKPRERSWQVNAAGNWHSTASWKAFWGTPNSPDEIAVFGEVITANRTVFLDLDEVVGGLRFANVNTYAISGHGRLTLNDPDGLAQIEVFSGNHQLQVEVALGSDLQVHLRQGTSLTIQNSLNLHGHDLEKIGAGQLVLNGAIETGGGSLLVSAGIVSGGGSVSGSVENDGGIIAPGNSPGTLLIEGNYRQSAMGRLQLEIAGTERNLFDLLTVSGDFNAGGALEVVLLNGFAPSVGDRFELLRFASASGDFHELYLPSLASGLRWDTRQLLTAGGGYISVAAQVPEPSSWLLAFAAVGFAAVSIKLNYIRSPRYKGSVPPLSRAGEHFR